MDQKSSQHTFSITGFREGRQRDFNYAYDLYYGNIYTFANNMVKNQVQAEDIAADTFTKLWRLHENFESLNNIKAFLYTTCRNGCIDYFRHLKAEREAHAGILHLLKIEELIPGEMIDAEVFTELTRLIERLPKQRRKIFKLIYNNHLGTSEVAQEMSISNQNVLNQKAKAIQFLRNGLMQKFFLAFSLYLLLFLFIIP